MFYGVFETADDMRRYGASQGMLPESVDEWIAEWERSQSTDWEQTRYCLNCDCSTKTTAAGTCWYCGQGNLSKTMPSSWQPCSATTIRNGAVFGVEDIAEELCQLQQLADAMREATSG